MPCISICNFCQKALSKATHLRTYVDMRLFTRLLIKALLGFFTFAKNGE